MGLKIFKLSFIIIFLVSQVKTKIKQKFIFLRIYLVSALV